MVFWWVLKAKWERKANSRESIRESKRPGDMELASPATALGSVVLASCLTFARSVFSSVKWEMSCEILEILAQLLCPASLSVKSQGLLS